MMMIMFIKFSLGRDKYVNQVSVHLQPQSNLFFKYLEIFRNKGPVKANQVGENSSFIFTVYVKSVPLYHCKLAYVVLHMAVKEFFKTHF